MTENFLAKQYVDHFLQREILDRLAIADAPIRFSDLKEDGIENSLFMYHANKLIDRGLVEKQQGGFQLTTKGARWINFNGSNLLSREALPRPLVQCIISANDSVLIANRTGSMKGHLNEFMLPGGLHHFGKSAEESISLFFQGLFTESIDTPSLISVVEAIITNDDEFVHHTISHVFVLSLPSLYTPKNLEKFEYKWMDAQIVNTTNEMFAKSQIVPTIVERQHKLKEYEVFKLH